MAMSDGLIDGAISGAISAHVRNFNLRMMSRLYLFMLAFTAAVVVFSASQEGRFANSECKVEAAEQPGATSRFDHGPMMSVWIAMPGTQKELVDVLKPAPGEASSQECIEERINFMRYQVETVDSSLVIPGYLGISLALGVWSLLLTYRNPYFRNAVAALFFAATALLAGLDYFENAGVLAVLEQAHYLASWETSPALALLNDDIAQTHRASRAKWCAAAVWSIFVFAIALNAAQAQMVKYRRIWRTSLYLAALAALCAFAGFGVIVAEDWQHAPSTPLMHAASGAAALSELFIAIAMLGMRPPWSLRHSHMVDKRRARQASR